MFENRSKFCRGIGGPAQLRISQATDVHRIESAEEGARKECGARQGKVVRGGGVGILGEVVGESPGEDARELVDG